MRSFFASLEAGEDTASIVALHMGEEFVADFADTLSSSCPLDVRLVASGDTAPLECGSIYLPRGGHVVLHSPYRVRCVAGAPFRNCIPSVDVLFMSAARWVRAFERVVGVVFTGMGDDGALGALRLHDGGAVIFAQACESALVDGMPAAVRRIVPVRDVGDPVGLARAVACVISGGSDEGPEDSGQEREDVGWRALIRRPG